MDYKTITGKYFSSKGKKDEEWYRERVARITPTVHFTVEEFEEMRLAYDILHDNLDELKKEFNKWCDPLGIKMTEYQPVAYPVYYNKLNVLKGEMLKNENEYSIGSLSKNAALEKTKALQENITANIQAGVERLVAAMQNNADEEQLQQIIQQETERLTPEDIDMKNFKTEWELFFEFAVRYFSQTESVKRRKVNCLEDIYAANRFFIYVGWRHGKPYVEIRNPLYCGFHKSGNEEFTNKGEYFYYRRARTYADIYEDYKHDVSPEIMEDLRTTHSSHLNKGHSVIGNVGATRPKYQFNTLDTEMYLASSHGAQNDKTLAEFQTSSGTLAANYNQLIWETHIEFKDYEMVYFVSYNDELGNKVTIAVSDKFNIPKGASKSKRENKFGVKTNAYSWVEAGIQYDVEEVEVPIKREVIILGNDIYAVYRKVPNQHIDVEDPYGSFNLSTFGTVFAARNSRSISPLQRAHPLYMQYLYVKHKQNKEIAKYQGYVQDIDVDQIPTALAEDEDGNLVNDPVKVWMTYLEEGKNFYSGSQTTNNMPVPPTRAPGSTSHILGTANEIFALQNFLQLIDQEIGMVLGVPPQREAQFATNSNASDNRQALIQSYHITEPIMSIIDEVWRQVTEEYTKHFVQWCEDRIQNGDDMIFTYVLPDGSTELFEVTPEMLNMSSLGLYVKSNSNRKEYNNYMLANIQAFSQNQGEGIEAVSEIVKSITEGQSADETHRQIQVRRKQLAKQLQEQQEQAFQQQLELEKREEEKLEREHKRELEKIRLEETIKGEYNLKQEEIRQRAKEQMSDGI